MVTGPGIRFTGQVKEELAALRPGRPVERRALLAGLLRFGASLHLRGTVGPRTTLVLGSESGGVARLGFWLLQSYGVRSELRVRSRGALAPRATYEVVLVERVTRVLADTGILDDEGSLVDGVRGALVRGREASACFLRGAFLGRGSIANPPREPHLEIGTPDARTAADLASLAQRLGLPARAGARSGGSYRVVVKGGEAIGTALVVMGAQSAYLAFEDGRMRREVRAGAVRLANADQANLRRTVSAAVRQSEAIAQALRAVGWGGLDPELAEMAALRLAHPQATLAELGALLDPPRSKGVVLGRLRRLEALGAEAGR